MSGLEAQVRRIARTLFWGSLPQPKSDVSDLGPILIGRNRASPKSAGGGTGRGVAANAALAANRGQNKLGEIWRVMKRWQRSNKQSSECASTPLPVPPPQGGREPSNYARRSIGEARSVGGRRALVVFGGATLAATAAFAIWIASLGPPPLGAGLDRSTIVLDREGRLLRAYATQDGRWRFPVKPQDVDRRYLDVLLAYEDKRFRAHAGIDPFAFGRALVQFVRNGRIVSGGSTLTMQVARLLEPRAERRMAAKLRQTVRAVEIERVLTKDEVLALYLGLAPYGGNLEGVRAASLAYFGKEPRRLTLGEAALLVALPQSPEARRPDRGSKTGSKTGHKTGSNTAREARDRVLDRLAAQGTISTAEAARAKTEPLPAPRKPTPMLAPLAPEAA